MIDRIDYAIHGAGFASPCLERWILADLIAFREQRDSARLAPPMDSRPAYRRTA